MPDWSYQTLFRPILFRLQAERARDLTLGTIGWLSRLPFGPAVIELFGHMAPPEQISQTIAGIEFPTPVGLEAGLDPGLPGVRPLSQFGFGYIEVGPITHAPLSGPPVTRRPEVEAIWYPDRPVNQGLAHMRERLEATSSRVPLGARLAHAPGTTAEAAALERRALIEALRQHVNFFTLTVNGGVESGWSLAEWDSHLWSVVSSAGRPVFLVLPPDLRHDRAGDLAATALRHGIAGLIIGGGMAMEGGRVDGLPAREPSLALLRYLRERLDSQLPIIAGGGIHEPADALLYLSEGARLVHVHAGLVYSGPGLPKRINEAVFHQAEEQPVTPSVWEVRTEGRGRGWLSGALMAIGIWTGATLATWIALTQIVMPYDERFVGLSKSQLHEISPRLLPFMRHDRISLSGTMAASALLFFCIALFPWRNGEHWARSGYIIPASFGLLSFFLYPIYGYFEPLHALFYLSLLPFFVAMLRRRPRGTPAAPPTSLRNDRVWRLGQWGQLLWVILGVGGTVAGLTITYIGLTKVFVPEDLTFMGTTAEALRAVPRLVPLISHDRVGFGTALTCNGVTVSLMALWGFRRGARWLWWTFLAAGFPSYIAAFGTHIAVGYTNLWHLTPPLVGLVVLVAALACSYPYLCADQPRV